MKRRFVPAAEVAADVKAFTIPDRDAFLDIAAVLMDDPEAIGSTPIDAIPGARQITTPRFDVLYTYGDDHVSVWRVRLHDL